MHSSNSALGKLPRKPAVSPEVYKIVARHIDSYFTPNMPTVKTCYKTMLAEVVFVNGRRRAAGQEALTAPSFLRFNLAVSFERHARCAAPHRPNTSATQQAKTQDAARFGERVRFETIILDAALLGLPSFRIRVCFGFDEATGYVTGFSLSPMSEENVALDALRMTLVDKSDFAARAGAIGDWSLASRPEIIEIDNQAFDCSSVRQAAAKLGIEVVRSRGYGPNKRPAFMTLLDCARSFSSPSTDNDLVWAEVETSDPKACLQAAEIYFARLICDHYHNLSLGLLDQSVREAAAESLRNHSVHSAPNRETLRMAFGIEMCRPVHNGSVVVMGRSYASPSLAAMESRADDDSVTLLFDLKDPSAISVKNAESWVTAERVADVSNSLSEAELTEFEEKMTQCLDHSKALRSSDSECGSSGGSV